MISEAGSPCGKSWFLADLSLCEAYLREIKLTPVCDNSVRGVIISRIVDLQGTHQEVAKYLDIVDRVAVMDLATLALSVEENPGLVWITCGTPFGLPLRQEIARQALKNGRIVGVASASALNAGYGGLALATPGHLRRPEVVTPQPPT